MILVEADHFKIAVNSQHFAEFHFRLSLQSISHIAIDGDVKINSVKFEGLAKSPMDSSAEISKPLGFLVNPSSQSNLGPPASGGRPSSPYDTASFPYPTSFGPSPTAYAPPTSVDSYSQNSPSNPYGPYPGYNPYGPPSQVPMSGRVSPSPYGPPPSTGGYPYSPPGGTNPYQNPQGYPQQSGHPSQGYPQGYPSNSYPTQPGPYPGTSVVYPGQEKKSEGGGFNIGPIAAAGAAALAGVAGSALMGGKHKKKHKHGYGDMLGVGGHGLGPAAVMGGVSSLLGGNKHGHSKGSSSIPIGGAMAGGAAALAGAYMLSKSPIGKVMKPKKMKKLYKHKHKSGGWGGFGSSSSSSSSDEE